MEFSKGNMIDAQLEKEAFNILEEVDGTC